MAHVTDIAILLDGRMLPKKRSTLLLVTAKAQCSPAACHKQLITATVGIVTGAALHARLAVLIPDQVSRAKPHGVPLRIVTAPARLELVEANDANRHIGSPVLRMATETRETIRVVGRATPLLLIAIAHVTGEAKLVCGFGLQLCGICNGVGQFRMRSTLLVAGRARLHLRLMALRRLPVLCAGGAIGNGAMTTSTLLDLVYPGGKTGTIE